MAAEVLHIFQRNILIKQIRYYRDVEAVGENRSGHLYKN